MIPHPNETSSADPPFTFRHRWSEGNLLTWDNRYVQHYAIDDYGAQIRVIHRATVMSVPA